MHALTGDKARWAIAGVAAVVVLAAFLLLFRLPPLPSGGPPPELTAPARASVQIAKSATSDAVLAQELILRDMRPLFLPTEQFNVSVPEPHREPGRTFLADDPLKFSFSEAELDINAGLPPLAVFNAKPAQSAKPLDAISRDTGETGLQGFGRTAVALNRAPARGASLAVVALISGNEVLSEVLPLDARPPGDKPWEPMELMASVNAAGLVAPLVVTTSSRVEEVDAHFRNFLARSYRIGDRLPPGFYRITVGP